MRQLFRQFSNQINIKLSLKNYFKVFKHVLENYLPSGKTHLSTRHTSVLIFPSYRCFVLFSLVSLSVFEDETNYCDRLLNGHLIVSEVIILQVWQIRNLMITSAAHLSFLSHNSVKHSRSSSLGCHLQLVPAIRKTKYQGKCYQVRLSNKSSTDGRIT